MTWENNDGTNRTTNDGDKNIDVDGLAVPPIGFPLPGRMVPWTSHLLFDRVAVAARSASFTAVSGLW